MMKILFQTPETRLFFYPFCSALHSIKIYNCTFYVVSLRASGLVVKSNVAIVGPRVRFSARAIFQGRRRMHSALVISNIFLSKLLLHSSSSYTYCTRNNVVFHCTLSIGILSGGYNTNHQGQLVIRCLNSNPSKIFCSRVGVQTESSAPALHYAATRHKCVLPHYSLHLNVDRL